MGSHPAKDFVMVRRRANAVHIPSFCNSLDRAFQGPTKVSPSVVSSSSSSKDDSQLIPFDESNQSDGSASKQLVVYDPTLNGAGAGAIEPFNPEPINSQLSRFSSPRVLPAVGTFTAQCGLCLKWRLIPTKEKYEEIRERVKDDPFVCRKASEWRPDISCEDPTDISQNDGKIWAMDKPSIAQPPRGWQRLLRIRGKGSTKFADIYYQAPSGKRLRSMVEIENYLAEHPEYTDKGVKMSQFSFQIPKPLQEDYVRKRPYKKASYDDTELSDEVRPLAWLNPDDTYRGMPGLPPPYFQIPDALGRPPKKARTPSKRKRSGNPVPDFFLIRRNPEPGK